MIENKRVGSICAIDNVIVDLQHVMSITRNTSALELRFYGLDGKKMLTVTYSKKTKLSDDFAKVRDAFFRYKGVA